MVWCNKGTFFVQNWVWEEELVLFGRSWTMKGKDGKTPIHAMPWRSMPWALDLYVLVTPYNPIAQKTSMKMTHSSFFLLLTPYFWTKDKTKFSSQHIVWKHIHYTILLPLYLTSFCIFASRFYLAPPFYVNASTGGDPVQFFGQIVYICILRCGCRFVWNSFCAS